MATIGKRTCKTNLAITVSWLSTLLAILPDYLAVLAHLTSSSSQLFRILNLLFLSLCKPHLLFQQKFSLVLVELIWRQCTPQFVFLVLFLRHATILVCAHTNQGVSSTIFALVGGSPQSRNGCAVIWNLWTEWTLLHLFICLFLLSSSLLQSKSLFVVISVLLTSLQESTINFPQLCFIMLWKPPLIWLGRGIQKILPRIVIFEPCVIIIHCIILACRKSLHFVSICLIISKPVVLNGISTVILGCNPSLFCDCLCFIILLVIILHINLLIGLFPVFILDHGYIISNKFLIILFLLIMVSFHFVCECMTFSVNLLSIKVLLQTTAVVVAILP